MRSHEEMVGLQAREHDLVTISGFRTEEEYVLHLMHRKSYLEAAKLVAGCRVLDLGCNVGYGTRILASSAASVVGVDVSEKAISTARAGAGDPRVAFQVVDGNVLPFGDGEFESVVSFQVIEHVVDRARYLGELRRVLRPGGLALLTTPNAALRLEAGTRPWNPFHVHEFAARELAALLGGSFSHVAVYGMDAREPLRSVECARVEAEKRRAREPVPEPSLGQRLFRAAVPSALHPAAAWLRRVLGGRGSGGRQPPPRLDRYHLEDLRYSADDPDASLDLLAVCSDGEEQLRRACARLG